MKKILVSLLFVALTTTGAFATTLTELDEMCSRMLTAANYALRGDIVADSQRSSGLAAVASKNGYARIYVHPKALQTLENNTWAFIMGHELAHVIRNDQHGSAEAEWEADLLGAKMAQAIGYELPPYIDWLYSNPNSCSRSHGCLHSRAKNLEVAFGLESGTYDTAHRDHRVAQEFPNPKEARAQRRPVRQSRRLDPRLAAMLLQLLLSGR